MTRYARKIILGCFAASLAGPLYNCFRRPCEAINMAIFSVKSFSANSPNKSTVFVWVMVITEGTFQTQVRHEARRSCCVEPSDISPCSNCLEDWKQDKVGYTRPPIKLDTILGPGLSLILSSYYPASTFAKHSLPEGQEEGVWGHAHPFLGKRIYCSCLRIQSETGSCTLCGPANRSVLNRPHLLSH